MDIRCVLQPISKLAVIGEAANGSEAIQLVKKNKPDIIVMDIHMPEIDGLETTRRIRLHHPKSKIIIVSCFATDPYPARLFEAGASAYVSKSYAVDEIKKAVKSVLSGKCYMSPAISQQLVLDKIFDDNTTSFNVLSLREMQIALMIIAGKNIQEIGHTLCLSDKTIRAHRYQILKKLKINNDVLLVLLAKKFDYLKNLT